MTDYVEFNWPRRQVLAIPLGASFDDTALIYPFGAATLPFIPGAKHSFRPARIRFNGNCSASSSGNILMNVYNGSIAAGNICMTQTTGVMTTGAVTMEQSALSNTATQKDVITSANGCIIRLSKQGGTYTIDAGACVIFEFDFL